MKKKILFLLISLVFALLTILLIGCAEIKYTTTINEGGSRTIDISVKLDSTLPTEYYSSLYSSIKSDMESERENRAAEGRNVTLTEDSENCTITLTEAFEDIVEYYKYMGVTGYEKNEPLEVYSEEGFFVNYLVENTVISSSTIDVFKNRYSSFIDEYEELQLDDELTFQYVYGNAYQSVTALNSDYSYEKDGITYNVWYVNLDNPQKTKVQLLSRSPKVWAFELMGIGIGLVVVAVIIVLYICKKKRKFSNQIQKNINSQNNSHTST